ERRDERIERQQPLGRPAPVDGGLAYSRPRRDLLDRHGRQPAQGQQVQRGGQDRAVRLRGSRPPPARRSRNIPAHRPLLPSRNPKRSVTYLIGIMPGSASPQTTPSVTPAPPATQPADATPTPPARRQPLQLALILVAAFMVVLDSINHHVTRNERAGQA